MSDIWYFIAFATMPACLISWVVYLHFNSNARQRRKNDSLRLKIEAADLKNRLLITEGRREEVS